MLPDQTPFVGTGPRGCGKSRKAGGVYAELGLGPNGQPVEYFLIDPPRLLPFDMPLRTQLPIWVGEMEPILHLLDWVGAGHYPNVTDFVEEVRRMGLSRLLPESLLNSSIQHPVTGETIPVLAALTPDSRLVTVHPKAHIHNITDYPHTWDCPRWLADHKEHVMCAGAWWWDVEGGVSDHERGDRAVKRHMPPADPMWAYDAYDRLPDATPAYSPAMFASWPLARLTVVKGDYGEHEKAADILRSVHVGISWGLSDS